MRNSKFIASLMCFNIMVSCVIDAFVIISPRSTITCAATGRRVDIIQLQGMINNNKENDGDVGEGGKEDKIDRIMNLETEKNDNLVTYEELSRDPELLQMEGQSSKKNFNKLFLLDRVGRAFNAFFYLFVFVGFILKANGYGYMRTSDGWITITTLQNREFQVEMNKKDVGSSGGVGTTSADSTTPK